MCFMASLLVEFTQGNGTSDLRCEGRVVAWDQEFHVVFLHVGQRIIAPPFGFDADAGRYAVVEADPAGQSGFETVVAA